MPTAIVETRLACETGCTRLILPEASSDRNAQKHTLSGSVVRPLSEGLTEFELTILRAIPRARGIAELAKKLGTTPAVLGKEIAKLQLSGYLGGKGEVTDKALKLLGE